MWFTIRNSVLSTFRILRSLYDELWIGMRAKDWYVALIGWLAGGREVPCADEINPIRYHVCLSGLLIYKNSQSDIQRSLSTSFRLVDHVPVLTPVLCCLFRLHLSYLSIFTQKPVSSFVYFSSLEILETLFPSDCKIWLLSSSSSPRESLERVESESLSTLVWIISLRLFIFSILRESFSCPTT